MTADPPTAPSPVPTAVLYRVVALACRDHRLAVAGGGVLRLDDALACPPAIAGSPVALRVAAGRIVGFEAKVPPDAKPPKEIPRDTYTLPPPSEDVDDADAVTVTIVVEAPARTPPGDDLYLSTERSGWSPAEIRLDRIDVRTFRAQLKLHRGAHLAFRITRGSIATSERDGAGAIPPPHTVTADGAATATVRVPAWGDIS